MPRKKRVPSSPPKKPHITPDNPETARRITPEEWAIMTGEQQAA